MPALRFAVIVFVLVIVGVGVPIEWMLHHQEERMAANETKLMDARAALAALPSRETLTGEDARATKNLEEFQRIDAGRREFLYAWLKMHAAAARSGVELLAWWTRGRLFEATAVAENASAMSEFMRGLDAAHFGELGLHSAGPEGGRGYAAWVGGFLPQGDEVPAVIDSFVLSGPTRLVPVTYVDAEEFDLVSDDP